MSDALITIRPPDLREIARGVALMRLPPNLRKRLLARMGRLTIAQAQKNVREQKTVDGKPFRKRQKLLDWEAKERERIEEKGGKMGIAPKSYRRPMLVNLVRTRWMAVNATPEKATVFFPTNRKITDQWGKTHSQGYIASKHQFGSTELFYREQEDQYFREEHKKPHFQEYWQPCTEQQALYLIRYGFPGNVRQIMERVSAGKAYNIARMLKRSYQVTVPARPFLGVPDETKRVWSDELLRGIYERFKAKNHKNLLT